MGAYFELCKKISDLIDKRTRLGLQVFFRGEPECFPSLSSSLYRYILRDEYWLAGDEHKTKDGHVKESHLFRCETRILAYAANFGGYQDVSFTGKGKGACDFSEEQLRLFGEIQIRGGKTNFIDFTKSLDIALFFACYPTFTEHSSSWRKDGRIIIYYYEPKSSSPSYPPLYPQTVYSHIQNNVLLRPKNNGVIDLDKEWFDVVTVSFQEKKDILSNLGRLFDVGITTLYNGDLQGYIRNEDLFI